MIDVKTALDHFGINSRSIVQAVQQVREYIEDGEESTKVDRIDNLMQKLISYPLPEDLKTVESFHKAVIVAQSVVEEVIKNNCIVEDVNDLITKAIARMEGLTTNVKNSWMFVQEAKLTQEENAPHHKVGGRMASSLRLYNEKQPKTNKEFVSLLMSELKMTKSGATTYSYNVRKHLNLI